MLLADFPQMLGGTHANMAYIAGPYSHPDPSVIEARMEVFADFISLLMSMEIHAISPLMNHPYLGRRRTPGTYDYWEPYSRNLLKRCDAVIVIDMPGTWESKGVKDEIKMALEYNIPVFVVRPDGRDFKPYVAPEIAL